MSIDRISHFTKLICSVALLFGLSIAPPIVSAQERDPDEFNVRVSGYWFRSSPSVTVGASGRNGFVDFNRDFGFSDYSTFLGKIDWKFTRKNHLYLVGAPFIQSKQVVLNQPITFRDQTFSAGTVTRGELQSILYAPGYQYDITRRKRGHLGIAVQFNLFDSNASLRSAEQVTGSGVRQNATYSHASLLAPIPVAGPEGRIYLTKSPLVFLEGNLYGMYFFGYGNYLSTTDDIGLSISKHFSVKAGYALGSRLKVKDTSSRVGMNLTQKGPLAGVEVSF